jgi:hypothetical protein
MFQREDWQVDIGQAKDRDALTLEQPLFRHREVKNQTARAVEGKRTGEVGSNEY